jgi:hypothetical protein
VRNVESAVRSHVLIDKCEISSLELHEKPVPADFLEFQYGPIKCKKQWPGTFVSFEGGWMRPPTLRP